MTLGLPRINVTFEELGITAIKRGEKGVVALVLYDDKVTKNLKDVYKMFDANDIPKGISEENKIQIQKAWMGYITTPKQVVLVFEQSGDSKKIGDTTQSAFSNLEHLKWDILAVPFV